MDDLISRQTAIDALGEEPLVWNEDDAGEVAERNQWKRDVAAIKALPSAERRGRWIRTGEDGYCSVCKCDMPMFRNDWKWEYTETPYCPYCGAKMDEVTNED